MSHPTIYIVDRDPAARAHLQSMLQRTDRHLLAYPTSTEFLADLRPSHPCCLILDLHDQTADADLLQTLRARDIRIPVIAISDQADLPALRRALQLSAIDLCLKPLTPDLLLPLVQRTLDSDSDCARQCDRVAQARRQLASLTPRERELFRLVVDGKSNKEMGASLGISARTVEHHRAHISAKLGLDRVTDMVRLGLVAESPAPHVHPCTAHQPCPMLTLISPAPR